jgi:cyclopropane-fatty-acyl-phospholipid synthase
MDDSIARLENVEHGLLTASRTLRRLCRRLLLAKLGSLRHGALRLVEDGGEGAEIGTEAPGELRSLIQVHDDLLYPKVVFGGAIGAAEAYVAGAWSSDDLTRVQRLFLRNRETLQSLDRGFGRAMKPLHLLGQWLRANSRRGSRRNIGAHYDLSNEFFSLFLDERRMYSSAIFESAATTLDEAQEAKLDRLCKKLELSPADHLLEIGTGWGGFAIFAASRYGCRVTTTTISREQYAYAREAVRAAGLEGQVTVLLEDYRDLRGSFDKLVSIEMIEAVGHEHLERFFRVCSERLAPHGLMALQAITIADRFYPAARRSVDFIQRYIFPGSAIPSHGSLAEAIARAGDLQVQHLEDIGPHYATTLREWRRRFLAQKGAVKALGFSDRFLRLWEYYLSYCEAGFLERATGDLQLVLAKSENRREPLLGAL